MNKIIVLILLVFGLISSCTKKDPCEDLVNGVYQFPEVPKNHGMTRDEVDDFLDLPKDICNCISTEGLIETIMNYPYLGFLMAGSNPQQGYAGLVAAKFRGPGVLANRPDRVYFLLKKYKTLDPLGYDPNWEPIDIGAHIAEITHYQIVLSQYRNLEAFTENQEKIELIETAIKIYDKEKEDTVYTTFSLGVTSAVMARQMELDNYKLFLDAYDENNIAWDIVETYLSTDYETVELIYSLSKQYLQTLKNK